jgi:hypothetical protein
LRVVFVGLSSRTFSGALLGAALLVTSSDAREAVLKDTGRLREGPGGASRLLGEVQPGRCVDVTESGAGARSRCPTAASATSAEHLIDRRPLA